MRATGYRRRDLPGYALLLCAPPIALVRLIGWPLPDQVPSQAQWQAWLHEPLTWNTIVATVTIVGWLIWATYAATVVLEVYRWINGRWRLPRLSIPGPVQAISAAVLGATAVSASTGAAAQAATSASGTAASQPGQPPLDQQLAAVTSTSSTHGGSTLDAAASGATIGQHHAGHSPTAAAGPVYQARRGDWVWHIADRFLGDPHRYRQIAALNPHLAKTYGTAFPDHIEPGDLLYLPAEARDHGPRRRATGTTKPAPSAVQTPPQPGPASPSPRPPAGEVPSPQPSVSAPPAGAPATVVPSTDTGTPTATQPAAPPHQAPGEPASPGWIPIAGGLIGAGFAAGLLYAADTVRKRRRHRYQPTPITSPTVPEDRTKPLNTLTDHLRHTRIRPAPDWAEHTAEPGPTLRQYQGADLAPVLAPLGPTGSQLAGVGTLPLQTGLGLRGPGAADAARAVLVATLTAGRPDDPDAQGRAVITAAALDTLLGRSAAEPGPMRRLSVTASFADALTVIEEEIIRRSRILADHEAADLSALRDSQPLAESLPQLLLFTDQPDERWHTRLATTIQLGASVEIGAVVIGDWPHGTTLTVAADGSTNSCPDRIAVLETAAARDILTMLAEAHGDTAPPTIDQPDPSSIGQPEPTAGKQSHHEPDPASPTATIQKGQPPIGSANLMAIRVLGTPAILGPDGTPMRGLRAKSLELLVYLAIHRKGAALGDIMEAIWGDATTRRAAQRLSTCVANLRSVLRAATQPHTHPDSDQAHHRRIEPVVNTGSRYHLDPGPLQVDWWTVLDEYTQVAAAADDTTRLRHLQAAIAAIDGGLADGTDYEWIDTDREHARRRIIMIYAHAAQLLADTDPHQARAYTDLACDLDPLSDDLARRAMRAAASLGDGDAVRTRLAALRRQLEDAGIDLDPETEHLAADLLHQLTSTPTAGAHHLVNR